MDRIELAKARAEQASQVLNNPLFEQAFEDTRHAIMEAWAGLNPSEERHSEFSQDLHRMVRCLERVRRCLKEHITTGKLAQRELEGKKNMFGKTI